MKTEDYCLKIIDDLLKELLGSYNKYIFYNEDDIIFVLRNNILKKDSYNYLQKKYFIFNEFPIRLKYPRIITGNVYTKLSEDMKNYFEDYKSGYYKIKSESDCKLLCKDFEGNKTKDYDIGVVNVDLSFIKKVNYIRFVKSTDNKIDKEFEEHELVLEMKFERDQNRKIVKDKENIDKDLRKDLNRNKSNKDTANNDISMLQKDIDKINYIVQDGLSKYGCFVLISEGGMFRKKIIENKIFGKYDIKADNGSKGFVFLYYCTKEVNNNFVYYF